MRKILRRKRMKKIQGKGRGVVVKLIKMRNNKVMVKRMTIIITTL